MAFVKETSRGRVKAIALLETIQNQGLSVASAVDQESRDELTDVLIQNRAVASKIRLLDTGDIAIKNSKSDGIYINRKKSAILISSKFVNINSEYLNIKTRPDGFRINNHYLNPEVLKYGEVTIRKDNQSITVPLFIETNKDTEFDDLLQQFGII